MPLNCSSSGSNSCNKDPCLRLGPMLHGHDRAGFKRQFKNSSLILIICISTTNTHNECLQQSNLYWFALGRLQLKFLHQTSQEMIQWSSAYQELLLLSEPSPQHCATQGSVVQPNDYRSSDKLQPQHISLPCFGKTNREKENVFSCKVT